MSERRIVAWMVVFLVIFNLGFIFHEIIAADFFARNIGHLTRERYIIPLVALSFAVYSAYLVYLYPMFYERYADRLGSLAAGALMGGLIGFLWDGLQGGLIEVATFTMPMSVFVVDSAYHMVEGVLAGVLVAFVMRTPLRERAFRHSTLPG